MKSFIYNDFPVILFFTLGMLNMHSFVQEVSYAFLLKSFFCVVVVLGLILKKPELKVDVSLTSVTLCLIHLIMPMFLSTKLDYKPISIVFGRILTYWGMILSCLAVIDLWGSFAVLPASRELQDRNLYSFVRHPIYLGYVISNLGWVLIFPSDFNFLLLILFLILTHARIKLEEINLSQHLKEYENYSKRVKHRMIPWLY